MANEKLDQLLDIWMSDRDRGLIRTANELCADSPELAEELSRRIQVVKRFEQLADVGESDTLVSQGEVDTSHSTDAPVPAVLKKTLLPASIGNFKPLEILGEGGMGAVYLAEDPQLGRRVAVKVMKKELAADADAKYRFLREARAMATIEHDNIMTIYAVGEDQGMPYLVMPVLKGETLDDRLRRETRLSVAETRRIGQEIAAGLAAAHSHGLIHRDIKPSNIWLEGAKGRVRILDFGLARPSSDDQKVTHSGAVLGTPAYMAPEQAAGIEATPRSDLFSLGAVLYRMTTGQQPFAGPNLMATLNNLANRIPESPQKLAPELPAYVSSLIDRLLSKTPEQRPVSAAAVLDSLQNEETLPLPAITIVPGPPKKLPKTATAKTKPSKAKSVVAAVPSPASGSHGIVRLLLISGLAGFFLIAAVIVYRIQTDHGTLVVEIDDDQVEAKLKKNGLEIVDAKTGRVWTLTPNQAASMPSGDYKLPTIEGLLLKVTDDSGAELTTAEFKIKRGDKTTVKVALEQDMDPATITAAPPGNSNSGTHAELSDTDYTEEREVAEWVSSIGGDVEVIKANGKFQKLPKGTIPVERFTIRKISLKNNAKLADDDMSRFLALSELHDLYVDGNNQLTDNAAKTLGQIASLRQLDMTSCRLTDAGIAHLAKLTKLTTLRVNATNITDSGIAELAKAPSLQRLFANSCRISIVGLRALDELPLNVLMVGTGHTEVQESDLPEITTMFPDLTHFDTNLKGQSIEGLSPLSSLPKLRELYIGPKQIEPGPPHNLASCRNLKSLQIYDRAIPADSLTRLSRIPQVKELSLTLPRLDEQAVEQLAQLTTIQKLTLSGWSGGDGDLMKLVGMTGLRSLQLTKTRITVEGVNEFHKLRPDVQIAGDFSISAEAAKTNFATERAVAEWVVSIGGTVTVRNDSGKNLTFIAGEIPREPFSVTRVNLLNNPKLQVEDLQRLTALSRIASIDLAGNSQLDDAATVLLGQMLTLEEIELSKTKLSDRGMADLTHLPRLKNLWITATVVGDSGISELANVSSLRGLYANGCPISIVGLRTLRELPIEFLTVATGSNIMMSDLPEISELFPNLRFFDANLKGEIPEGISPLARLKNLRELFLRPEHLVAGKPNDLISFEALSKVQLYKQRIPPDSFSELAMLPRITELDLIQPIVSAESMEQLAGVSSIQKLRLSVWTGGDADLLLLAGMTGLRELTLEKTQVTQDGVRKFHEMRPDVELKGDFRIAPLPNTVR